MLLVDRNTFLYLLIFLTEIFERKFSLKSKVLMFKVLKFLLNAKFLIKGNYTTYARVKNEYEEVP